MPGPLPILLKNLCRKALWEFRRGKEPKGQLLPCLGQISNHLTVDEVCAASTAQSGDAKMEDRLLTVSEARERLGCISRTKFYQLVAQRRLELVKLGSRSLVRGSAIDRFIAELPVISGPARGDPARS